MKNRLPFVVGVTGHRDLGGADAEIAGAVKTYLAGLSREYPGTPILLLSSLAEGADQLVVETALALRGDGEPGLEVELVVPLPEPEATYLRGFSPGGLKRYHEL